jgi:dolichol-phosphate mannosyltransferase
MQKLNKVWVVMPVYNEEASISHVLDNWLPVFETTLSDFTLCVLNDGSKDGTLQILQTYAEQHPQIQIVDKPNSGHGQSCILGYQKALEAGAEWVFQIDSDGQCNPAFFQSILAHSDKHMAIYGYRKTRDDGWRRFYISRVVSIFIFMATRVWVKDANVPYRLMHASALRHIVDLVPKDFHLANILISTYQQYKFGIKWVNIHFDDRFGGEPSVKVSLFAKHGLILFKQLRSAFSAVRHSNS